jgi:hypothetical protein
MLLHRFTPVISGVWLSLHSLGTGQQSVPSDFLDRFIQRLTKVFADFGMFERELEVTIDGVAQIARAGLVAIVPSNVRHSVTALTDGRAIIVDHPARPEFGQVQPQVA